MDEIGDIDAKLQVKLLRVLDWGEFYRLGGVKKIKVDVRLVASTNSDLRRAVEEGRFRKDLYYRLAQVRLEVPPLRERPEDILALLKMFCDEHRVGLPFSSQALDCLLSYSWPGNIRELRSLVIGLWGTVTTSQIRLEHLPMEIRNEQRHGSSEGPSLQRLFEATASTTAPPSALGTGLLEQAERALVETILKRTNGHQEKAADILGISSRTLRRKLQVWEDGISAASQ